MLKIILKDIKTFFRNRTVLFWGFIFPIALTFLLGNALNNIFPTRDSLNNHLKDIKIEYVSEGDQLLTKNFTEFLQTMEKELAITSAPSDSIEKSMEKVKNKEISLAVEIRSNNQFMITKNREFKSEIADNIVKNFVERVNLLETVNNYGEPTLLPEVLEELYTNKSYLEVISLNREKRDVSALDYYGIVNVFALVFWLVTSLLPLFTTEVKADLLGRIRISGISKSAYLISKFISLSIFLSFATVTILLFNLLVFDIFFGDSLGLIILLLLSSVLLVSAIATFIIAKFTKLDEGAGFLDSAVPIIVFLGGGLMPIMNFTTDSGLNAIAKYTPLFVQNRGAFGLINGGNYTLINQAFQYNLSLTIILMIFAIIIFNRRGESK